MTDSDLGVLGDHIATEAVRRITHGIALGTPSLHNMIREAAIDTLVKELDQTLRDQVKSALRYLTPND